MAADNNDFTHEFQIYSTDLNAGTIGTGKFLLFDNNINAVKVESIDNIKIGGGEEGQVLVTDGAGNLTWATSSGGGGVAVNADWNSSSGASRILNKPDLTAYLPKSGGTLTGKLNAAQGAGTTGGYSFGGTEGGADTGMFSNADGILDFYADNIKIVTVTTSGVTSTQAITLPGNPTSNLQAATKQYVDSAVGALNNFSGNYNDLTNKPTVATSAYIGTTQVAFNRASGNLTLTGVSIDGNAATVSNGVYTSGNYSNPAWIASLAYSKLTDAPSLATVATSGAYADLTGKPALATVATSGSYTDLTNKPSIFSGSYTDLTNKPTLFDGAYLSLTGAPNLAAVATSGSYNDLSNKPSIPDLTGYATEAWVNAQGFGTGSGTGVTSYNDLTDKPTLFSGDYNDLVNTPPIPATTSDLTNDSGFITSNVSESIVPTTDNTIDLGSPTNRFRHLYVAPGTIYLGDIKLTNLNGKLDAKKVINPGEENEYEDTEDSDAFSPVRGNNGATSLDGLEDVDISDPQGGQSLVYNALTERWINGTPSSSGGSTDRLVNGDLELVYDENGYLTFSGPGGGSTLHVDQETAEFTISTPGDIVLNNTSGAWTFSNGNIILPAEGDIKDSNGNSVLGGSSGGSGSLQYAYVVGQVGYPITAWTAEPGNYTVTVTGDAGNELDVEYGGWGYLSYDSTGTTRTVTGFSYDSEDNVTTITLDYIGEGDLTGAEFYAVRRLENFNTVLGNYGALDIVGDRLFVNNVSDHINFQQYNVTVNENGVITMNTARGGIEFGAQPEEGAPQHLHIMRPAGQEGSTDLYFGDDYNYVKMPSSSYSQQGVEIGSSLNQGTVSTWRFGTDGKLTLPQDGDIVDSTGTSVLGGGSGNSLAPELTKSNGNLVATTTLEFQGEMFGTFFDIDSGGNFDVWISAVTGNGDISYAIGSNDDNYNFVYAFTASGAVLWKVGLDDINGNDTTPYSIEYKNDFVYVVAQYYNSNKNNNHPAVIKLNAGDGSVAQSYVLTSGGDNNHWYRPYDIAIDSNNNPVIVGQVYGEMQNLGALEAQAGSGLNFLVVNASAVNSGNPIEPWGNFYIQTDPNDANALYQPQYINTFFDIETTTLTGSGTGLRVAIRYRHDLGSGSGWRFDWCWITNSGSGFNGGDQVKILGSQIGGTDGVNDVILSHNGWYMNILSTDAGATSTQEVQGFVYNYVRFYMSQGVNFQSGSYTVLTGLNNQAFIWTPVWQHTYGNANSEVFKSVDTDSNGNVYVLGNFEYNADNNWHYTLAMKLDGDGDQVWTQYVETTNYNGEAGSILVNGDNQCFIVSKDNNGYTLVTKLGSTGELLWQSRQTNGNNWNNYPTAGLDGDGNIAIVGSWSGNDSYVTSIQRISGSDGSLMWARQLRNEQNYDMYEYYDEETQASDVSGNNIYYGGYCYDANDDRYVGFGFRVPTDGTGTGTYGRYIYSTDNDASWEDNTSNALLTSVSFPAIDGLQLIVDEAGVTTTADAVGSTTVHHWGIGNGGGMTGVETITFADGTTQSTAYNPEGSAINWTNNNGNTWQIKTYNGGANVSYNGGDWDACWFDSNSIPSGDNQLRGAIIQYHAFSGQGTTIGTIHVAYDYSNDGSVTHIEHMSGNSNTNTIEFWWRNNKSLYMRRSDGNSANVMIQFTATLFYGSEFNC